MKLKFNWIDALIILVLISVGILGYRILKPSQVTNNIESRPVEVTIRIERVLMESINVINEGTIFSDKDTNLVFGKVIDKKIEDAYDLVETSDGRIVKTKVPNRYNLLLTLEGDAHVTEDFISLGGREVRLEGTIHLKNNISAVQSKVVDIKIPE